MKSNYNKIGQYIRLIDERNFDLKVETLLGLTINKDFIPSVANTVGSDMSRYKIIRKSQFACSLMQVRRDKKIPVALQRNYKEAIISQAYPVFDVTNKDELLPEYLMMWFSRSEFDREACFYAVGGVRGSLEWEDFRNMQLPVPDIEKQKAIVKEYNTIVNRIKLNEQLNQKLEETAQAIYKEWFVDFEFPMTKEYAESIGKPELEGKAYKANGGKMVWNEELGEEIPKGWGVEIISDLCEITSSKRIFQSEYVSEGVPFFRGKEISLKKEGKPIINPLHIKKERYMEIIEKNDSPEKGDILLTAVGTLGVSYLVQIEKFYFKDGNIIWFKKFREKNLGLYIYDYMQSDLFKKMIEEITIGSTQNAITIATLGKQNIISPNNKILSEYYRISFCLNDKISHQKNLNTRLFELKDILLSKMSKG